jgi:hypothetical protein
LTADPSTPPEAADRSTPPEITAGSQPPTASSTPDQPPTSFQAPEQAPRLDTLTGPATSSRDPKEAFQVVAATLTTAGASAWNSAHNYAPPVQPLSSTPSWTVDQPWQSSYAPPPALSQQFPAPGTPQWFALGAVASYPTQPAPQPVTLRRLIESVGWAWIIVLTPGFLLQPLSFFCLGLAFVCVQVMAYRHRPVYWLLAGAWLFAIVMAFVGGLFDASFDFALSLQITCGGALVGGLIIQYLALLAGDRPRAH